MTRESDNSLQTRIDEALVREYLPVVKQIARRYSRASAASLDDLVQVGSLGLLKAVQGYDRDRCRNASFHSYAQLFIKGEIRHYLRDQAALIQQPRRLSESAARIVTVEEALKRELQRTPTLDELSLRSGLSVAELVETMQSSDACHFYDSLDGGTSEDDCNLSDRGLSEVLADKRQTEAMERAELREILVHSLRNLGAKTREIIEFVYFQDLTQKETAQLLGWSEMKVSRAVKKGLAKLKEILLTEIF